jgi:predicted metalloprotease
MAAQTGRGSMKWDDKEGSSNIEDVRGSGGGRRGGFPGLGGGGRGGFPVRGKGGGLLIIIVRKWCCSFSAWRAVSGA